MNARGYSLTSVGDGEEWISADGKGKTELYDWATQCDLGSLTYRKGGDSISYYLVYGNALWETISDYGYNTDQAGKDADEVSDLVSDFYDRPQYH